MLRLFRFCCADSAEHERETHSPFVSPTRAKIVRIALATERNATRREKCEESKMVMIALGSRELDKHHNIDLLNFLAVPNSVKHGENKTNGACRMHEGKRMFASDPHPNGFMALFAATKPPRRYNARLISHVLSIVRVLCRSRTVSAGTSKTPFAQNEENRSF